MKITNDILYVGVNDHEVDLLKDSTSCQTVCLTIRTLFAIKNSRNGYGGRALYSPVAR